MIGVGRCARGGGGGACSLGAPRALTVGGEHRGAAHVSPSSSSIKWGFNQRTTLRHVTGKTRKHYFQRKKGKKRGPFDNSLAARGEVALKQRRFCVWSQRKFSPVKELWIRVDGCSQKWADRLGGSDSVRFKVLIFRASFPPGCWCWLWYISGGKASLAFKPESATLRSSCFAFAARWFNFFEPCCCLNVNLMLICPLILWPNTWLHNEQPAIWTELGMCDIYWFVCSLDYLYFINKEASQMRLNYVMFHHVALVFV